MQALAEQVRRILPTGLSGRVSRVVGQTVSVAGFPAPLGAECAIARDNGPRVWAEVVGFREDQTLLAPYTDLSGTRRGQRVTLERSSPGVRVGEGLLGRVLDGRGRFIDDLPSVLLPERVPLQAEPVPPLERPRIDSVLGTGIRAIDALLTIGQGQRVGLFSGSGVGKSVLLGQMARHSAADVNVVVLVGERGREVREFLDKNLTREGLARSVVVAATSDESALLRLRAARVGTAIAEYFRDTGRNVLLVMDSVTRVALAQREIGLAAGEPPATRGYPPSVFAMLPRLLERSGRTRQGSITGLYSVLVEGDDPQEPIADTVRGVLDGHIVLSRKLARQAHWPAIDVLASISRSMPDVVSRHHRQTADEFKQMLAACDRAEDLIALGAYQAGSNRLVDAGLALRESITRFLQQGMDDHISPAEACDALFGLGRLQTEQVK